MKEGEALGTAVTGQEGRASSGIVGEVLGMRLGDKERQRLEEAYSR